MTSITLKGSPVAASGVHISNLETGKEYDVQATTEVIVSAGAIDSPKLLMLSGIGNATALAAVTDPLSFFLFFGSSSNDLNGSSAYVLSSSALGNSR